MFAQRRQGLLDAMPDNSMALIASGEEQIRNRDVEYAFRASSDFYYLTGFAEPNAILVLQKQQGQQSHLFLRPKDLEQEIWQGRRLGVENAPKSLKIDQAWCIDDFAEQMSELIENIDTLLFSFAELGDWQAWVNEWIQAQKAKARKGISAPKNLQDIDAILHEMRLIKSPEEIEVMRQAAQISVQGHLTAMRCVAPQKFEYQVQADMENTFSQLGSQRIAYGSIVASGENACVLHYTENRAQIEAGQLVLIDAGAELDSYAGDITTTFPASGKFTPAQAQLYELTLAAQQAAIAEIKPNVPYDAMHNAAVKVITEGLVALGILQGDPAQLIAEEAYKAFFMHGTGHWLGMDVHDVGDYKQNGEWRNLQPGMVVTVEPGIYIAADAEADSAYQGIGIRIEDDVVVTETGHDILTTGLPRTVAEIEAFMAER